MSSVPTDKTLKYDRQLRLWAANGQSNIENCHICLVGVTTANIELLKNLLLPGCGKFTIIDDGEAKDLSHNFFWSEEGSLVDNLKDLNPETDGNLINCSLDKLSLEKDESFWSQFTIVVMDDSIKSWELEEKFLRLFWNRNVPVIKNVSYGFYGYTRVVVKEHSIIETHPESLVDVRVDSPWKELEDYSNSIDLDSLDDVDHAHVPYVIILIKLLQLWKQSHDNEPPSPKDRALFKKIIESLARTPLELNFQEAIQFSHRATNPPVLKQCVADIITNAPEPALDVSTFWIYVKALQAFILKNNNQLPLSGVFPDMTADTLNYVALQRFYKAKFDHDRDALLAEVALIVESVGRPSEEVDVELASIFCKNARFLAVQRGSKLLIGDLLHGFASTNYQLNYIRIYLAFLAVENLKKTGTPLQLSSKEDNYANLLASVDHLLKSHHLPSDVFDDEFRKILQELARSGGSELHNVSSFMGGIGSQEALKFITGQYVPIDNTVVFDGIISHSECLKI